MKFHLEDDTPIMTHWLGESQEYRQPGKEYFRQKTVKPDASAWEFA